MKVKMILPALTEAKGPFWRSIKYSLFPPLGLATLAGYFSDCDDIELIDEHVEHLQMNDTPDLVVLQVYITSAKRSYEIADHYRSRGVRVVMGGIHVTTLPDEAAEHADTIFLGPGEDIWPQFLNDLRNGNPQKRYQSTVRSLSGIPDVRRDLIKRNNYLVPNSLVVSRGCPHKCDFCYKESFYSEGNSFYTARIDDALREIDSLPGKHLYFLDDNLFGDPKFAADLFREMEGMGRVWQAAGTVQTILNRPDLLDLATESGLRSLFVGFETINESSLQNHGKVQNLNRDYNDAIRAVHNRGVMINASFVYGMDGDTSDVFDRTINWSVSQGLETSTFHIMTPYPGTELFNKMVRQNRMRTDDWNLFDTRHVTFKPLGMTPEELEKGYWKSYKEFYSWNNILNGASTKSELSQKLRHIAYSGGWKKMEPFWNVMVKSGLVGTMRPLLENILSVVNREKPEFVDLSNPAIVTP